MKTLIFLELALIIFLFILIERKNQKTPVASPSPIQSVNLKQGITHIHALILVKNHLFGLTDRSPAQLVKIDKNNPDTQIYQAFPADGNHNNGADLVYSSVTDNLYAVFGGANLTVSEIARDNLQFKDIFSYKLSQSDILPSLTNNNYYLYLLTTTKPSFIFKIDLKTKKNVAVITLSEKLSYGHSLRSDDSYLYATGENENGWFAKINPETFNYQKVTFSASDKFPTDDMGVADDAVYVGLENGSGELLRIDKKSLMVQRIQTGIPANSYGVYTNHQDVWDLLATNPGKIARLNLASKRIRIITLDKGEGYPSELADDGRKLYVSLWLSPKLIILDK